MTVAVFTNIPYFRTPVTVKEINMWIEKIFGTQYF